MFLFIYKKSQNDLGWKGLLEVIQPNPASQAGSAIAGFPGLCPGRFSVSPQTEMPQKFWAM